MSGASHRTSARFKHVHTLVEVLVPAYPDLPAKERAAVGDDVAAHVAAQLNRLPPHLAIGARAGFAAFRLGPLLRYGRAWTALDIASQRAYIALWDAAPIPPLRDFLKLIRSLVLFAYFDHAAVRRALAAEEPHG